MKKLLLTTFRVMRNETFQEVHVTTLSLIIFQ